MTQDEAVRFAVDVLEWVDAWEECTDSRVSRESQKVASRAAVLREHDGKLTFGQSEAMAKTEWLQDYLKWNY